MEVWIVYVYNKDGDLDEVSEPYLDAEYAMRDWQFNDLEWTKVVNEKFSGTKLTFWRAEGLNYDYELEPVHVNGS